MILMRLLVRSSLAPLLITARAILFGPEIRFETPGIFFELILLLLVDQRHDHEGR